MHVSDDEEEEDYLQCARHIDKYITARKRPGVMLKGLNVLNIKKLNLCVHSLT